MSNEQNTIIAESKHEHMIDVLFAALKNTRDEETYLSLEEISKVIAGALASEELDSLIVELLDRQIEQHNLGKCLWCQNDLSQEDFDMHKGICQKCLEKEIEDKINTDFVVKPDNENDF